MTQPPVASDCSEATASAKLGYEDRRDELEHFVDQRYIHQFKLEPASMLDVGCGDGFWTDIFARRGFSPVGIDPDTGAINAARRRCLEQMAADRYLPGCMPAFQCCRLQELALDAPSAPAMFRLVFARTLPHFYQPDLEPGTQLVRDMLRFLHPQGRILLSIYSDQSKTTYDGGQTHHHLTDLIRAVIEAPAEITATGVYRGYLQIVAAHPTITDGEPAGQVAA